MKNMLIYILLLIPFFGKGQYLRNHKQLSFYFGQTYRLNNSFYNTFDISYEHYVSSCLSSSYNGYGIRLDNYRANDLAISVKYFQSIVERPSMWLIPYYGISPVLFKHINYVGLNLKPEIGLRFFSPQYSRKQFVNFALNISYAYDIPIFNDTKFMIVRHDFYCRGAVSINLENLKYYSKKNRKKNENEEK